MVAASLGNARNRETPRFRATDNACHLPDKGYQHTHGLPKAFSVLMAPDGDRLEDHDALVTAIRSRDIFLFKGWYNNIRVYENQKALRTSSRGKIRFDPSEPSKLKQIFRLRRRRPHGDQDPKSGITRSKCKSNHSGNRETAGGISAHKRLRSDVFKHDAAC